MILDIDLVFRAHNIRDQFDNLVSVQHVVLAGGRSNTELAARVSFR